LFPQRIFLTRWLIKTGPLRTKNILFIAVLLLTRLARTKTPVHRTVIRGSLGVAVM